MARYIVKVGATSLVAAAAKTILQIVTGAKQVKPFELHMSFNGITPSDVPAYWELVRQTTSGTATANTLAPVKSDPNDGVALAAYSKTFTVEPATPGDSLLDGYLTPNGGVLVLPISDIVVAANGGTTGRLGLVITPTAMVSVLTAIRFEE